MGTSKLELQFLVRHGVTHMSGAVADNETETLQRHREETPFSRLAMTSLPLRCQVLPSSSD
jgi:hypothetical protein